MYGQYLEEVLVCICHNHPLSRFANQESAIISRCGFYYFLSINLYACISNCLSIYQAVYFSVSLSIYCLPIYFFVFLPVYLFLITINTFICLICYVCLSLKKNSLSVCLSVWVYLTEYLSVYSFIYMSVFINLLVCLSVFIYLNYQ